MIVYGYAKGYRTLNDGTCEVKVRIPNVHGPMSLSEYKGKKVTNYIPDKDLPYYRSILLPYNPNEGDVVMLMSVNDSMNDLVVIGLTGGSYLNNKGV